MSDNSDPGFIAARELDATLQKLRSDVAAKDAELKLLKEGNGSKASATFHWLLAVVFAALIFSILHTCGRRPY